MGRATPVIDGNHECDLFLLTSHHAWTADRILPQFALRGRGNIHGWGIGWYAGQTARILRRADPAVDGANISGEFAAAIEAVSAPVILGHLRLTSRGATRRENNHPFSLSFLGYGWLLVHNGTASDADSLVPPARRRIAESDSDTPRVFEFLAEQIAQYCERDPKKSLIEACRAAFEKLLETDSGKFNLILTNGHLTIVLIHWRPFYLRRRLKDPGDVTLISTLKLTDDEEWVEFAQARGKKARMLVFSGPTLLFNGDVPR
ncbi:MAG: hypothetical protein EXS05_11465 [Planctomycetaceae bacterium]|nr:hypothetical protein [Planctomycetaceae bacterium]